MRTSHGSELESFIKLLTGTSIASEIDLDILSVAFRFILLYFDSSVKVVLHLSSLTSFILICAVNDVAESCCESAVELDFRLVFISACFVQIGIDEAFHRVNVQDVTSNLVIRVRKDFSSQRLVQMLVQIIYLE